MILMEFMMKLRNSPDRPVTQPLAAQRQEVLRLFQKACAIPYSQGVRSATKDRSTIDIEREASGETRTITSVDFVEGQMKMTFAAHATDGKHVALAPMGLEVGPNMQEIVFIQN